MKYTIFLFCLIATQIGYSQTYNLNVTVSNFEKTIGTLLVSVYNQKDGYLQTGMEIKTLSVKVTKNTETVIFEKLPKGNYAVALYHDKNNDGKCNCNFLGIPKEGFGFSKNIKPVVSAPTFDDCKIELNKDKTIIIELIN